MELKQYWNVIWKRRWLVLAIVFLVAAVSALMALTAKRSYETEIRLITRQEPSPDDAGNGLAGNPGELVFTFNRYYNWFGSEFLVDDYTQIVESDAFAASVLDTMREPFFPEKVMEDLNKQAQEAARPGETPAMRGSQDTERLKTDITKIKVQDIREGIEADRRHRILRLNITGPNFEVTKALADASAIVLADARLKPVRGEMVDDKPVFSQIENAKTTSIASNRSKEITNAVIRIVMGLVAALALAFLFEYLDTSIRDERDAKRVLEMPVLGTIPKT